MSPLMIPLMFFEVWLENHDLIERLIESDNQKTKPLVLVTDPRFFTFQLCFLVTELSESIAVVKKQPMPSPFLESQNASCMDSWITYNGKYFYKSKEKNDWFMSLKFCTLYNASLAVIDTQKELDFWVHILRPFDYWFDLSRETNKVWKWSNGTEFKNQFPIHGEGLCAYINSEGASSAQCYMKKDFLCSCNKTVAKLDKTTSSKVGSS